VWQDQYDLLHVPTPFNLRMHPFERMGEEGGGYKQWMAEQFTFFALAMARVAKFKQPF